MRVKLYKSFLNKTKQVSVSKWRHNSHALRMIHFAVDTFVYYCSWNIHLCDIGTYTQDLTEKPTEATNIIFIDLKGSIKSYGQPVDVQLCLLSHAKYALSIHSYKNM